MPTAAIVLNITQVKPKSVYRRRYFVNVGYVIRKYSKLNEVLSPCTCVKSIEKALTIRTYSCVTYSHAYSKNDMCHGAVQTEIQYAITSMGGAYLYHNFHGTILQLPNYEHSKATILKHSVMET